MATCTCTDMVKAMKAGHLECLDRLCDPDDELFDYVLCQLIKHGKLDYIQFLLNGKVKGYRFPNHLAEVAVHHRQFEILKAIWFDTPINFDAALIDAIDHNLPEYICFMVQNRRDSYTSQQWFLQRAALGGHRESYQMLVFLGYPTTPELEIAMNRAFTLKSI